MSAAHGNYTGDTLMNASYNRNEEDIDKYVYLHKSIREVLTMEPLSIPADFLASRETDSLILIDKDSCTIQWDTLEDFLQYEKPNESELQDAISMGQLVTLASQSELAMVQDNWWRDSKLPSPILGLFSIIPQKCFENQKNGEIEEGGEYFLVATLLALNMVESSIRNLLGKKNGRAPLLKDMIDLMASNDERCSLPDSLVPVLRALLLPKNGLNLRNLLWHGFLPTIHRRWFSLSIVLCLSLDKLAGSSSFQVGVSNTNLNSIKVMRTHKPLLAILSHGEAVLSSREKMNSLEVKLAESGIMPRSHVNLLKVLLEFVNQPIIFSSVAGPLIEHILRLLWCDENNQNKYVAEPGSYYLTLDGHGQRDKHEVVIMPFFCPSENAGSSETRNKLVYRLGGSTMAFLMDMFTAPSGAPNIRASVAHGSFNKYLFQELDVIGGNTNHAQTDYEELMDMVTVLLSVLDILSESQCSIGGKPDSESMISSYRPCFSYSSSLLAEVDNMVTVMNPFYEFIRNGKHLRYAKNSPPSEKQMKVTHELAAMSRSIETIVSLQESINRGFGVTKSQFSDEDFFKESINNSIASECGAAKLLLSEISHAVSMSFQQLNDAITSLEDNENELSSRRRKQAYRICSSAHLTLNFYSFAAYCALRYIDHRQNTFHIENQTDFGTSTHRSPTSDELFIAVKRSRMVLSTFSTTNTFDRALSALAQYAVGKAVKAVGSNIQEPSTATTTKTRNFSQ